MGNLKGTARTRKEYLHKKKHPIRWRISQYLKAVADWINNNNDIYLKKGI